PLYKYNTALPVDLIGGIGILYGTTQVPARPNYVTGQPLYVFGAQCATAHGGVNCPGGMGFNPAAFTQNNTLTPGTVGPNALRGFNAQQLDLALRRDFPLHERFHLQFSGDI